VQKLIEIVSAYPEVAYDMLLAFIAYQVGRGYVRDGVARRFIECLKGLSNMKGAKLSRDELLKVLGMARWVYQAISRGRGYVCRGINVDRTMFSDLLNQFASVEAVISRVLGV